ncbi:hypothetical protein Dimus_028771, partial [Dionaea muscipula]
MLLRLSSCASFEHNIFAPDGSLPIRSEITAAVERITAEAPDGSSSSLESEHQSSRLAVARLPSGDHL